MITSYIVRQQNPARVTIYDIYFIVPYFSGQPKSIFCIRGRKNPA